MFSGKKYLLPNFLEKIHWKITCLAIFEEFSHSPELDNFKSLQAQRVMFSSKKNEKDAISKFFNDFGNTPFLGVVIISLDRYLCYITQMLIFFSFLRILRSTAQEIHKRFWWRGTFAPDHFSIFLGLGMTIFFEPCRGSVENFPGSYHY